MKYLLVFTLVVSLARAAEPPPFKVTIPPLETSRVLYSSSMGSQFSYYVDTLARGYPVGQVTPKDAPAAPTGTINSFEDIVKALDGWVTDWQKGYAESQRKLLEQLREAAAASDVGSGPAPGAAVPAAPAAPAPVPAAPALAEFFACAKRALPLLKTKLQCERAGDSRCAVAVESRLAAERGNGSVVSPSGVACGKHLGPHGVPTPSASADIKVLAPLVASEAEAPRGDLWRVFALHGRALRAQSVTFPKFWEYAWKRLAFHKLFRRSDPPPLSALVDDFVAAARAELEAPLTDGKSHFVYPERDTRDRIATDWKYVEEVK